MNESHLLSHCPIIAVKTGRWAGVVTAFITMSDIKDEIDWEFPGNDTLHGQTNFFWQGVVRTCASRHVFS